jgi:hypothetical protein
VKTLDVGPHDISENLRVIIKEEQNSPSIMVVSSVVKLEALYAR